jgi:3'(2'), 5'-bisphosphate nucleotidase
MTDVLEPMLEIANEAARLVLEVYETPFSVDFKGPKDPVTAADRRANDLICRKLAEAFPGVPIVAEESDPETFAGYQKKERVFFVDPLDGTAEFIGRNGEFVVMIGLVEGTTARAGVIVAPAKGTAWAGLVGTGAWEIEGGARHNVRVSSVDALDQSRVVSSRSHRSPMLDRALSMLGGKELVPLGSAGLKGAEIASGRAEIYVGTGRAGKRWDACAVDALVTAAGGRFTDSFGTPVDYRSASLENDRGLLATNGRIHERVLAILEKLESR